MAACLQVSSVNAIVVDNNENKMFSNDSAHVTKSSTQIYKKTMKLFVENNCRGVFVYHVSINHPEDHQDAHLKKLHMFKILSPIKLCTSVFPLYSPIFGEMTINVRYNGQKDVCSLTKYALDFMDIYFLLVGDDRLGNAKKTNKSLINQTLIIPCKDNDVIDGKLLNAVIKNGKLLIAKAENCKSKEDYESLYINKVVLKGSELYYVISIENYSSNCDEKNEVEAMGCENKQETLLCCKLLPKHLNFLANELQYTANIPASQCKIVPLSQEQHHAFACLISVLKYLQILFCTAKINLPDNIRLTTKYDKIVKYDWFSIVLEKMIKNNAPNICIVSQGKDSQLHAECKHAKAKKQTKRNISDLAQNKTIVSLHHLLQALISTQIGNGCSSEPLKVLGEAYLVYLASENLYFSEPSLSSDDLLQSRCVCKTNLLCDHLFEINYN